jgi:hypothetical protein
VDEDISTRIPRGRFFLKASANHSFQLAIGGGA